MAEDTSKAVDMQRDYKSGGATGKGWLPGQRGNPKGRPPKIKYISELAAAELDVVPLTFNAKPNILTWRQLIVRGWLEGAVAGPLLGELLDRLEGRVLSKVDLDAQSHVDVVFQIGQGYKERVSNDTSNIRELSSGSRPISS